MLNHHPSPEILTDYASGSLRLSHALCLAAHMEHCQSCRQQAERLSTLGAEIFSQQAPKVTAAQCGQLKERVFAMLDDTVPPQPNNSSLPISSSAASGGTGKVMDPHASLQTTASNDEYTVPKSLKQFIERSYKELEWVSVSPSIKIATLLKDKDGAQIALSRVKAGGKMPHHRHTGDELTVVLEGSFSDESGIFRKGDFISRDSRHKHKPMVTKDAECICLMVLDAPIEFTGWFTRWLNPLLRRNHAQG